MNKNLIILTIGRLSQMIVMFATYRVLSSILSTSDMGVYYFLLSVSAVFGLICANPIGMYTNRMIHSWLEYGNLKRNLNAVINFFFWGSLLTIPFMILFKEKINLDEHNLIYTISVLVSYIFATTFNGTVIPSLNLLGFPGHFVIWTFLTNFFGLFLSYGLVKWIEPGPLSWLIGQVISFLFCGIIALITLYFKTSSKKIKSPHFESWNDRTRRVLSFAAPIAVTNVAVWSLAQSFRFFYKENVDLSILGELAFGLGLATSLSVAVEYLLQQIYLPSFYKKLSDPSSDKSTTWNRLLNRLIPPYLLLVMFMIGLSPFIMRILADEKFKNSYKYFALGAIVECLRMLGNIFTMATQAELKTKKAVGPYLAGGLVTILGVFYVCKHPEYVTYTPYCLMAGYFTALVGLKMSVASILIVKLNVGDVLKIGTMSLIFLTALLMEKLSSSLLNSIVVCGCYGLLFTYFLYRFYLKDKEYGE